MPQVPSVARIHRHELAVVVAEEHHSSGGRNRSRPRLPGTGHRILPLALAGRRVDRPEEELAHFVRLRAGAAPGETLLRLRLLGGAGEDIALFEHHDVEQPGRRIERGGHPIGGAPDAGTDSVAHRGRIFVSWSTTW